jgi:hypothetical protein
MFNGSSGPSRLPIHPYPRRAGGRISGFRLACRRISVTLPPPRSTGRHGEIGRRTRLKICWWVTTVRVRVPLSALLTTWVYSLLAKSPPRRTFAPHRNERIFSGARSRGSPRTNRDLTPYSASAEEPDVKHDQPPDQGRNTSRHGREAGLATAPGRLTPRDVKC